VLQEVAHSGTTELAELSKQDRQEYFHHLARLPAEKDRQRRRNVSSVILDTAEISSIFNIWPFLFN
jgi:deoxycytidylate deaminase